MYLNVSFEVCSIFPGLLLHMKPEDFYFDKGKMKDISSKCVMFGKDCVFKNSLNRLLKVSLFFVLFDSKTEKVLIDVQNRVFVHIFIL